MPDLPLTCSTTGKEVPNKSAQHSLEVPELDMSEA